MSAGLDRAEAYATSEELGELFERTALWLTVNGIQSGSRSLAQLETRDGSAVYGANENGDPEDVEKFEFEIPELLVKRLALRNGAGMAAVSRSVEYEPERYFIPGPGLPGDYSQSTCRFSTITGNPRTEEVLCIRKKNIWGPYTSDRLTFGHWEETDISELISEIGSSEILSNETLKKTLGMLCITTGEYKELSFMISQLESLK
ncbi:MAG: hypothetical protein ABIR37_03235 [Candidatus Saccharimonadales bacterium]